MIECPACASNRVPQSATHCNSCGYVLDVPTVVARSGDSVLFARVSDILTLKIGWRGRFLLRCIATALILYASILSGMLLLIAVVLSIPVGVSGLPGRGLNILLPLCYFVMSLIALVQCWRQKPFKPLTASIAVVSFLVIIYRTSVSAVG